MLDASPLIGAIDDFLVSANQSKRGVGISGTQWICEMEDKYLP